MLTDELIHYFESFAFMILLDFDESFVNHFPKLEQRNMEQKRKLKLKLKSLDYLKK